MCQLKCMASIPRQAVCVGSLLLHCTATCKGSILCTTGAYLLGSSLTAKEVFLESGSRLLKFIQAVLLSFNETMSVLCLAQWAEPLTLWNLFQRWGKAEEVTSSVTAVTQNDFLLMVASFAQFAVECEDVVWNPYTVGGLTCCLRILRHGAE